MSPSTVKKLRNRQSSWQGSQWELRPKLGIMMDYVVAMLFISPSFFLEYPQSLVYVYIYICVCKDASIDKLPVVQSSSSHTGGSTG